MDISQKTVFIFGVILLLIIVFYTVFTFPAKRDKVNQTVNETAVEATTEQKTQLKPGEQVQQQLEQLLPWQRGQ